MPNINLNYKMVTDIKNNFFTNNRFIAAESLPAEGDFIKGDLIVNIGENANDEAMWLCVESGNPGVWEVVGAGAGGGSSKIVTLKSRVAVNNALSEVNIGVSGFNKATDTLIVFNNARFMVEGVDYEINANSTKIVAMNGNIWNEELANDFVFDFVIFKMMNVNENGEVIVSSANEIVKLKNTVIINEAVNEVEIGIDGFNEGDDLTVYRNSVYMIEGIDYEVQGNKIVSLKGAWNAEGGSDYKFTFEVLKTVAKVNPDAVVGMEHLTEDVKEAIEAAGNIDLSGYATKEELNNIDMSGKQDKVDNSLVTNNKSIAGAINELFQDVDSGKTIIADAIDDINISKDSTFAAMGEAIEGIHADREEDRQKLIDILQGSNMNLSGNESMDTLLDLIDMSNLDLSKVVQMDGGSGYSFIVYDDGSVYSCGQNDYGQLGLGDTTNRAIFAQVTTNVNNDVKQVACGDAHTFILKNDGSVWSCGYNYNGQLGLGTSGSSNNKTTFTQVTTNINNDVKQIACGNSYVFILKNDGSVWSCGYNNRGQLGLNNTTNKTTFTKVTTNINNDVKQIDCGTSHTAILKNDGSVWSCCYNQYGTLGLNNNTDKYTFTQVTTNINNDVKQISCIANEIIILKNDGSVWGCGYNNYGQLGLGDTTKRTTFTQITTNGKKISSNNCSMLILKNDGSLWGCGLNDGGQLGCDSDTGSMTAMNKSLTQVTVNINNDVNEIFCGYNHSLIIKNDGSIWVAGSNSKGQLGLGDANSRNRFTELVNSDSLNNAILQLQTEAIINRGNLATVLTDEGVELTGDETLANLITKVDEELDRLKSHRRAAVVECNVSVDGSKGKNNGTRYSDTISTTVTTNFGFIPSIIILYFDIGGDNVVSGDIYDLSGTLEILIDNTNVSNSLLYATSVTENSFTLVSRNARDRNDGTGDLYYYKGTVIKIYGIE